MIEVYNLIRKSSNALRQDVMVLVSARWDKNSNQINIIHSLLNKYLKDTLLVTTVHIVRSVDVRVPISQKVNLATVKTLNLYGELISMKNILFNLNFHSKFEFWNLNLLLFLNFDFNLSKPFDKPLPPKKSL